MKNIAWVLILFFGWNASARSGEYWACKPMQGAKKDPGILISKGEGASLYFLTDGDLIRDEGRLPAGTYVGTSRLSESGYSLFATLDVSAFFPNDKAGSKGSHLSLALSLKSTLFATEGYLLFPTETSELDGMILNNYACKHHL